jgi:hypothetical protein
LSALEAEIKKKKSPSIGPKFSSPVMAGRFNLD